MLLPTQCLVPARHELFATSSPIGLVTLAPLPTWQRCLHCLATCFCHLAFECRLNLSLVTFRATKMLWFQAANMCSRHGGRDSTGQPHSWDSLPWWKDTRVSWRQLPRVPFPENCPTIPSLALSPCPWAVMEKQNPKGWGQSVLLGSQTWLSQGTTPDLYFPYLCVRDQLQQNNTYHGD